VAALFGVVFVLFAPFPDLRILVRDVTKDLAPPFVKRHAWARAYWDGRTQLPSVSVTER
jgi:hypothetical protein